MAVASDHVPISVWVHGLYIRYFSIIRNIEQQKGIIRMFKCNINYEKPADKKSRQVQYGFHMTNIGTSETQYIISLQRYAGLPISLNGLYISVIVILSGKWTICSGAITTYAPKYCVCNVLIWDANKSEYNMLSYSPLILFNYLLYQV